MSRNVLYVAAAAATVAVGALTTGVWGAQAPAHAPPILMQSSSPHPLGAAAATRAAGPVAAQASVPPAAQTGPANAPGLANTPGSAAGPVATPTPGYFPQGSFPPGNVAQIVGAPGNPGGAQVPGLAQASQFTQPGMNQPGQPPFGEMLYSMQTYMNQPGAPDFYTTYNPAVVQANEGVTPSAAYPNPTTPQTGVPQAAAGAVGSAFTQGSAGNAVGFYSGFGPGQWDVGFYAGFTSPR